MQGDNARRDSRILWAGIIGLSLAAALYRVVPYMLDFSGGARYLWNFAPVGALAIFAGARLRSRFAPLVPLGVMLASDLAMAPFLSEKGFSAFGPMRTPIIYSSFLVYVWLGRALCRDNVAPLRIGAAALLGSAQFFLLSNFAVWLGSDGTTYAHTLAGLGEAYWMALPFYRNTLGGDLLFTGLFFGIDALFRYLSEPAKVEQPV